MRALYYILNLTWGLPMTLVGWVSGVCLMAMGVTPRKWGGCTWYSVGECWGGLNLGLTVITDKNPTDHVLNHEFGHSIQNARYGLLFPLVVAIPSVVEYWKNTIAENNGKVFETYDTTWYEREATDLGDKYIKYFQ